jgi:hypothetical protein|tara:strand:+ start:641 stop:1312 length:672 start_codon:yes stop_codon:yes gene_type:complete
MPREKAISDEMVGAAMKKASMNKPEAAKSLGITTNHLHRIIGKSEKLKALYTETQVGGPIPKPVELLTRTEDKPMTEPEVVAALKPQGEYIKGLKNLGLSDDTISSITAFEKFEKHTGLLMVEALKGYLSLNIQQNMQLYEVSQDLKKDLDGSEMDPEMKIQYIKCLTQVSAEIGKGYDRSLSGINIMLKMHNEEQSKSKKKAGFQPLKNLQKLKEEADDNSN